MDLSYNTLMLMKELRGQYTAVLSPDRRRHVSLSVAFGVANSRGRFGPYRVPPALTLTRAWSLS